MSLRIFALLSLLVLAAFAPTGCAPVGAEVAVYGETTVPPPEPQVEYVDEAPSPDWVWVPGYWYWNGYNYVWVNGRYARPPAPGHVYVRSGWVVVGGHYRYAPGYWAPRAHRPSYRYVHRYPPPRPRPRPAPRR